MTEAPVGLDRQQGVNEAKAIDARNLVTRWVTEGQRMLSVVPKLLHEHEQLAARAETAERKSERCEEEIKNLRGENEHFRRERRQTVETLKALTKQLIESAGGIISTNS
jgi:predicted  nucleic acid-binding Zn-ribbon protein